MIYITALLPILVLTQRLWQRGAQGVDHLFLFNLGFFAYCSIPILSVYHPPNGEDILYQAWAGISALLDESGRTRMTTFMLGIWSGFHLGHSLIEMFQLNLRGRTAAYSGAQWSASRQASLEIVLLVMAALIALFVTVIVIQNKATLFAAYGKEGYNLAFRGPLQQALYVVTVGLIISYAYNISSKSVKTLLWIVFILTSLISLFLGTRQGVLLAFMALIVLICHRSQWLRGWHLIPIGVVALAVTALIGAMRQGNNDIILALMHAAVENHATFISAITGFSFNEFENFHFPLPLAAEFVNVVPTALWPGKIEYLGMMQDKYFFSAPLGAHHLSMSLLENFGYIGSILAVLILGAVLNYLRTFSYLPLHSVVYFWCSAILTTDIWRNPVSISVIKSAFQSGILVPLLLIFASDVVSRFADFGNSVSNRKREQPEST